MITAKNVTQLLPMRAHPVAEIFPMMDGADFDALVADIRANGQREPVVTHDGLIIDGRNRWRACQVLSITPLTVEWDGKGTLDAFIISRNLHRRHLTASQRAMVAGKLANMEKHRHRSDTGVPVSEAAKLMNVNKGSVSEARTILAEGTEQEIAQVVAGEVGLKPMASAIRRRRPTQQRRQPKAVATGRNVERYQRMSVEADIWAQLSDALDRLTGLPLPADVAEIVRKNANRSRAVDAKLQRALQWLEDFNGAWTSDESPPPA